MISKEQATEALNHMDDFARMDLGVDPIGPRKTLQEFINQKEDAQAYPAEEKRLLDVVGDMAGILEAVGAFVAGGAITSLMTNTEINDVDIYFPSKESFSRFMAGMLSGDYGHHTIVHHTNRSVLFTNHNELKAQAIVYRFFPTAEKIFDSFDFTVNMGAYCFGSGQFVFHKDFFRHNSQRFIGINTKTDYPLISALRVDKYRQKGYTTSKAQFLRLLLRITELELNSWDAVVDHIGGMYGIDPEKIFNRDKEFSLEEVIEQLNHIQKIDGTQQFETPSLSQLAESLKDQLTEKVRKIMMESRNYISSNSIEMLQAIADGVGIPEDSLDEWF